MHSQIEQGRIRYNGKSSFAQVKTSPMIHGSLSNKSNSDWNYTFSTHEQESTKIMLLTTLYIIIIVYTNEKVDFVRYHNTVFDTKQSTFYQFS